MPDSEFPFFCALGFVARIAATGPFFCSRRIAPLPELCPSLAGKTGGAGAVFCSRRIVFVPRLRLADGRSAGLRRNSPNSPKWFAFRAESIRKTLSDCLETRCGEGVCYEIVKYI